MGNPRLFEKFTEVVHQQGYSTISLLLPGHGGSVKEFASSTLEQWQGHVDSEIQRFSRDYPNIRLVGHSMGGLLALNAAARLNEQVSGVFVIASPLKLAVAPAKANISRMKYLFYRKTHPKKVAFLANTGIRFSPNVILRIIKPFMELEKLMHATKGILPSVRAPVTAVYSLSDELTSIKSLEILESGLNGAPFEKLLLSDSLHAYFPANERAEIDQALVRMLER